MTAPAIDRTGAPAAPTLAAAPTAAVEVQATPAPAGAPGHVPALDGVRGLAILAVVLHNASYVAHGPADTLAGKLFTTVMGAGWIGVQLFFVLSGFLITGILVDTKGSAGWLRAFYMRRVLRIFPLYYVTLLAYFVVAPALLGVPHFSALDAAAQPWYWSYLSNWHVAPPGEGNLGHFWSLAVEEQFYVLWPLVVLALGARGLRRACVALVASALAVRVVLHATLPPVEASELGYHLTIARWDALAVGALVALLAREAPGRALLARWAPAAGLAAAVAMLAIAAVNRSFHSTGALVQIPGQTALAVACGALVWGASRGSAGEGRLAAAFATPWLRWLGRYSYGIYVLHMLLHRAMVHVLGDALAAGSPTRRLLAAGAYTVAILGVSCVLALGSYVLVERPFLRLKRHFVPGRAAG